MKILYVTDLHGDKKKYRKILDVAIEKEIKVIVNGGDMLPKQCDRHSEQSFFINGFLDEYFEELKKQDITYLAMLGNDDLLAADEIGLTGLWFEGQKYFANTLPDERILQETEILAETKKWLDIYFSGEKPTFTPPLHPAGSTFRQAVWQILLKTPYGQTITYGEIASKIAERENISHMSAQAVGGAVGHNEISIIIPCHRVVGTNGSLTGYAGGIDRKISLLKLEHADMSRFFVPKSKLTAKEQA